MSVRWLWVCVLTCWMGLGVPTQHALAADAYPARTGARVSFAGFGLLAAGAVTLGTGGLLTIYDYNGPWERKHIYDAHYDRRLIAGNGLMMSSIGVAGAGVPLMVTGGLLEGRQLKKVFPRHTTISGWLAVGSLAASATSLVLGLALWSPALNVISVHLGVLGFSLAIVQIIHNRVRVKRLPRSDRTRLYGPPKRSTKKVQVMLAPQITQESKGLALVGVF